MQVAEGFKNPFVIVPDDPNSTANAFVTLNRTVKKGEAPAYDPQAKTVLIVDTNVLLKQMHIRELLRIDQATFDSQFEVITLDRVISEVKDEKSREYILNRLPYELDVKSFDTFVDKTDLQWVHNFAKDTGDFVGLSKVDMMVIALGVKMAREKGEIELVRREPKDLTEFRPDQLKAAYDAYSDTESDSDSSDSGEDEHKEAAGDDDGWNEVDKTRQDKRTEERLQKKNEWYAKKMQAKKEREEAARKLNLALE